MEFHDFCRASGLLPKHIKVDGKWHRCPTESHPKSLNGSYKLSVDGKLGFVRDWSNHPEPIQWKPEVSFSPSRYVDHAAIQRKKDAERMQTLRSIRGARDYFDTCQRLRDGHPYLDEKHLSMAGCSGLRVDRVGWLVVPMHINGSFSSIQRISPDGEKRFWPGAPIKGASYLIERREASITVICEGLATGLTIFAAAPVARVIVAFNAGNIPSVAGHLPRRGMAVIAADNDLATEARVGTNPGLKAAQEAAKAIGVGVAVPICAGTDWNDYRNERIEAEQQVYRRVRVPLSTIQRNVDGAIAAAIVRNAGFLAGDGHA